MFCGGEPENVPVVLMTLRSFIGPLITLRSPTEAETWMAIDGIEQCLPDVVGY